MDLAVLLIPAKLIELPLSMVRIAKSCGKAQFSGCLRLFVRNCHELRQYEKSSVGFVGTMLGFRCLPVSRDHMQWLQDQTDIHLPGHHKVSTVAYSLEYSMM